MQIIIFDTETTGLIVKNEPITKQPHLLQLSWIVVNDNSVETKDYYVKIPLYIEIPDYITKINGITREICQDLGMPLCDIMDEFLEDFMKSDYIVGHNIDFDMNIIDFELNRNNHTSINSMVKSTNSEVYCTMKHGTNITKIKRNNGYKYPKLIELYQYLFENIDERKLHNAKNDTLLTARCFFKMHKDFNFDLFEKYPFLSYELL